MREAALGYEVDYENVKDFVMGELQLQKAEIVEGLKEEVWTDMKGEYAMTHNTAVSEAINLINSL